MTWLEPTHDSLSAKAARFMSPGLSWCLRCGMPWNLVKSHETRYRITSGCFPLCEDCWAHLGHPEARIEYYKALIDKWESLGPPVDPEVKRDIQRAVANGL